MFILATNCYLPHSWSGWYHCILDLGLIIVLDVTSMTQQKPIYFEGPLSNFRYLSRFYLVEVRKLFCAVLSVENVVRVS